MSKGWFGPKRIGYGISPRTWQGWLATLIFAAAFAGIARFTERGVWMWAELAIVALLYGVTIALTYDPGYTGEE